LAAIVSKVKLSGATCTIMVLRGTTDTPALPWSSKSTSRTVMSVSGS
jgi:hypothetical protein